MCLELKVRFASYAPQTSHVSAAITHQNMWPLVPTPTSAFTVAFLTTLNETTHNFRNKAAVMVHPPRVVSDWKSSQSEQSAAE